MITAQAQGFTIADILTLVVIVMSVFGLLLSAIGVLLLLVIRNLSDRLDQQHNDTQRQFEEIRRETTERNTAQWGELRLLRSAVEATGTKVTR